MRRQPGIWLVLLSLAIWLAFSPAPSRAEELSKGSRATLLGGVVYLLAYDYDPRTDALVEVSSGSGTVISKDGWILTNFHVAFDYDTAKPHTDIAVGFTRNPKAKPELFCRADPTSGSFDRDLDVAVIKCDRDLKGNPLSAKTSFTPVPLGNSETVEIGDEISVIGYPGVGGETINFTSGKVSGFIGEDGSTAGDRWIKTEAQLGPGNSGGAAVNGKGELVGIPTQIHFRTSSGFVEKVNLIRPVNFAKKFIESSKKIKTISTVAKVDLEGVTVVGRVFAADNGAPIAGATVLFLKPGIKVSEVNDKNVTSKLYTKAISDRDGDFRTDVPLKRGKSYGVLILAEGFQSLQVDDGIETGVDGDPLFDVGEIDLLKKR